MAINSFTNILVGEATMRVGTAVGNVADVGATQGGVDITWEPSMVDIEVDQFGDAARVIQNKIKVLVKTTMAEATLANLAIAWGYGGSYGSNTQTNPNTGGTNIGYATNSPTAGQTQLTLGIHTAYPEERVIVFSGPAPGTTAQNQFIRTYTCTRAISYTSSAHAMTRTENVKLPVEFRILPDNTQTGKEYGHIIDAAGTTPIT